MMKTGLVNTFLVLSFVKMVSESRMIEVNRKFRL